MFLIIVLMAFITPATGTVYSRDQLLTLRTSVAPLNHRVRLHVTQLGLCRRGCRAGRHWRRRLLAARSVTVTSSVKRGCTPGEIPTVIGHRGVFINNNQLIMKPTLQSRIPGVIGRRAWVDDVAKPRNGRRCLTAVSKQPSSHSSDVFQDPQNRFYIPALYVFNAAALTKPHAIQQLSADLISYNSDVTVITETHFKAKQ